MILYRIDDVFLSEEDLPAILDDAYHVLLRDPKTQMHYMEMTGSNFQDLFNMEHDEMMRFVEQMNEEICDDFREHLLEHIQKIDTAETRGSWELEDFYDNMVWSYLDNF